MKELEHMNIQPLPGASGVALLTGSAGLETASAAFEILPIGVYACDASGRLTWFNTKAAELWGRKPAIGETADIFCGSFKLYALDGHLIAREETPMAHVLKTAKPIKGRETRIERPDGSSVIALVNIEPLRDETGKLLGAIGCFQDITDLYEARQDLAERADVFRQLLQALPAAIYTTDAEGRITFYNEAAAKLAGREPILGSDEWCVSWKLYWPDGTPLPHDQCPMAVALKENREVRGAEAVLERPDGTRVPFIPFPTPLRDLSGKLVGAVNMLVDISERKDSESNKALLLAELNHRVKNNMQTLQALLSGHHRETQNEEARLVLGEASGRVAAMSAASRALHLEGSTNHFDARLFIDHLCENARLALGDKIAISVGEAQGRLRNAAATPLALILNEFFTNAVKHAKGENGKVQVNVSLVRQNDEWILSVQDDGPGFIYRPSHLRFSGLGLVQGLASHLGGRFSVENAAEHKNGARLSVRFPAANFN